MGMWKDIDSNNNIIINDDDGDLCWSSQFWAATWRHLKFITLIDVLNFFIDRAIYAFNLFYIL